ncbi:DNA polymerase zeta processivity subunit isoform X2 [Amborella trichopoda]|uniref:DNA polymerase zeta processivity subunit isoform X2 n=1 Tax=Amborella trichopoda TaxID=13333 RepID=UPI0009C1711F|nr:DNA polymerase zeta processivity subunit isoform X2 [Amborella trichopoda]|eukprot:XP_020531170.1 DNA polymerase zeta processivity subunit isoform X2 [Amborella trichopoda]
MDRGNLATQGEIARILVEFLEVSITSVVFLRGIYPPEAFERRRYMNIAVQRARNPQLRNYIHSAVAGLYHFIQKGLVERVAVIFYGEDHVPSEKFVFKLDVNQSYHLNSEESDFQYALRSFLIKLSVAQPLTTILPTGPKPKSLSMTPSVWCCLKQLIAHASLPIS